MKYYKPAEAFDATYSVDMVRLRVEITPNKLEKFIHDYVDKEKYKISQVRLNSTNPKGYKHFISCTYEGGAVIKMGFYRNCVSAENKNMGFIEFNPNRIVESEFMLYELEMFIKPTFPYIEIARYDMAVDIPIDRNQISVIKDNRQYECIRKSALDFTEYLGTRNSVGRVKIYNKMLESKLDKPLTRVEITCDMERTHLPELILLNDLPVSDSALIQSVLHNDCFSLALANMSPYHRGRIHQLIENNRFQFDNYCINAVKANLVNLIEKEGIK